jgi:3-oxoadipate enol-lactonase
MPIITHGDLDLYHEVHGEGPALLLISGLSGGAWSWYGQVPYFKKHYFTITFDNRGAGRSSIPPGPYLMSQFAADALRALDHLKIDRAFVLALSMGGMIALELALLAPDRVRALVLGCTHCGGSSRIPPSRETMEILMNNEGLTQEQMVEKNLPLFLSEKCRHEAPEAVEDYRAAQLSAPVQSDDAFRAQLSAIMTFDRCEDLARISIPALIVTGSEDILVPPENAFRLGKRLRGSEVVVIQGAGHALHAECRDRLNELAHDFFRKQPAQRVST